MDEFWLEPTTMAQWQHLVDTAKQESGVTFDENVEHYLIITLDHFTQQPQIATGTIAIEFLQGMSLPSTQSRNIMRNVGDKCLIISGLFPDRAEKRNVKPSYYVGIGKEAYEQVGHHNETLRENADLFYDLSDHFHGLQNVLQAMRGRI